jgi:transcriptional/translational regulatory protein YebC/TACO1
VAWQFEQKGVVVAEVEASGADDLALLAIDAGADDFEITDSTMQVYCAPERLEALRQTLSGTGASIESSELSMAPTNTIALDEKTAIRTLRLLDSLEELDDVQKVYSNADFPDAALERYRAEE